MPQQVVIEDIEFLKMIIQDHTSAYAIHTFMKKQAEVNEKQKVISYKNIAERMLRLVKDGLIEETTEMILFGKRSIHGRKDYRISEKGLEQLIFSTIIHKEDVKTIADYLDKYYHDDGGHHCLGYWLMMRFADANVLLSTYMDYIGHPELKLVHRNKYDDTLTSLRDIVRYEKHPKPTMPKEAAATLVSKKK